jgi:dCMP deaminase
VKDDEVISTGYVGAPRGRANCSDLGVCVRMKLGVPRGERYELCRSVHAEANAIISASRDKMLGGSLYLVGTEVSTGEYVANSCSCSMCKRMIINAGIERVYVRDTKDDYRMIMVQEWIDNDESVLGTLGY